MDKEQQQTPEKEILDNAEIKTEEQTNLIVYEGRD